MNLSLEDVFSMHECIREMEDGVGEIDKVGNLRTIACGDITITYIFNGISFDVENVYFGMKNSEKAKDMLQEYMNSFIYDDDSQYYN